MYYTWSDPLKSRQLVVSYETQNVKINLDVSDDRDYRINPPLLSV